MDPGAEQATRTARQAGAAEPTPVSGAQDIRVRDASLLRIGLLGLLSAVLIRVALLPAHGFAYDLDQFVLWAHELTATPLGQAYRLGLPYPPVMVYVLAALAALDPVFRTAVAGGSAAVDIAIKLPATLADIGLAGGVAYALRERPRWALFGALAILLNPALWYLSAWWGQFDSLYVLPALVAYLLAVSDRPVPAAIALAVSVMTKPQALPFLVPFAAWFLARHGLRTSIAAGVAFAATVAVLWVPFLADGGLGEFVHGLAHLSGTQFSAISFQAWNPWWIAQLLIRAPQYGYGAPIGLVAASSALVGPITIGWVAYALAGLAELLVFVAVLRHPTPRALALGLTCATLLAFALLPSMHERYSVGAIAFLAPLLSDSRIRGLWTALSVVISANIVAGVPATGTLGAVIPIDGPVGIAGSLAMAALTGLCVLLLLQESTIQGHKVPPLLA